MPINTKVASENFERYVYARDNGHIKYIEKAEQCENYFAGLQWEERLRQRLERQGKPAITMNKVLSTIASVMGEQIENRADVTFRPFRNGIETTADALAKVYMQITNANKLDWLESEVASDGFITSRGFYDIRVAFEDQLRGEVRIAQLNPRNVVIDPDAESYDPAGWKEVFVTKWMSIDDIELLYGKANADLLRNRETSDYMLGYDSIDKLPNAFGGENRVVTPSADTHIRRTIRVLERQHKKIRMVRHLVDPRTGDMRPIPDTWDEERVEAAKASLGLMEMSKRVEQIRWTVTADNVLLHDEFSPYKFFTVVPYFPFFRRGRTIGLVENLISPQDLLNKSTSQELHVVNTTANSGWKLKKGSLKNMDSEDLEARGAETGVVLELDDVKDAEKIQPNQIPTGLDRLGAKADEAIKEVSGVSDSKRGFDRADVAAKAIRAKQEAGSVNLAKPMDNLARTRHLVAERVLALVQTYYTEERVIQISGQGPTAQTEEVVVNQMTPEGSVANDLTLGEYTVVVSTVPARDSQMQSQFDEALQLRELGIAIPDEFLVENSHLMRKAELIKRIQEANGGAEPTETQMQLADLELQAKQMEIEEKKAKVMLDQANAELAMARAQQAAQDSDSEQESAEIVMAREKMLADIQLAREKQEGELQLARDKMRAESMLKRAEAAERMEMEREKGEQQMTMQREQSRQQMAMQREQASQRSNTNG